MFEFIIGSSLAAAAGLNAWMPLFLLGLADRFLPAVNLPAGWSWLSSDLALWIIGILLVLEIIADKVPALDSVNDVIQSLLRPAAGGIAFGAGSSAQTIAVDDPSLFENSAWVPIAVGIGIALLVHILKATARIAANTVTGDSGDPCSCRSRNNLDCSGSRLLDDPAINRQKCRHETPLAPVVVLRRQVVRTLLGVRSVYVSSPLNVMDATTSKVCPSGRKGQDSPSPHEDGVPMFT